MHMQPHADDGHAHDAGGSPFACERAVVLAGVNAALSELVEAVAQSLAEVTVTVMVG